MKVSIIVPNRNYAQYLRDCLDSIVMQTYQNIEVLLADGGSNDGSVEILDEYSEKYGWKIYSYKDNGQVDAISRGLQLATGDIQCWLNSDDFFLSNKSLETVVNLFNEYQDVDILSLGGYYTSADGRWLRPIKLLTNPLFRQTAISRRLGGFAQPSTFWRAKVFHEIGLSIELPYTFDVYFFIQAGQKFSLLINQDIYLSGYRWHGDNLSFGVKATRINDLAKVNLLLFGFGFRYIHLKFLEFIVRCIDFLFPKVLSMYPKTLLYAINNFLSFISIYYIPGI
jgi:glycosyltransferase involved in cell wall biosynthesis